jgi:hypothetical protein
VRILPLRQQGRSIGGSLENRIFKCHAGFNYRTTFRFNALMKLMRAIMVGPLCPTTSSIASTAACHSASWPWEASGYISRLLKNDKLPAAGQRDWIVERALPTPWVLYAKRSALSCVKER